MRREGRGDLVILCYHAVSASWEWEGSIAPSALAAQVERLLDRGYVPRTLSDALRPRAERRTLAVTFDDAFHSVLTEGFPVLRDLGVPATVFAPTDYVSARAPLDWSELRGWVGTAAADELRCMSWEELAGLDAEGWEVGSHTCSHPRLTELGEEEARRELIDSRAECEERLGKPCRSLAYPFGAEDGRIRALTAEAGYAEAVTLGTRLLGPRVRGESLRLSREGVYRSTPRLALALATSPALGRLRAARTYVH